VVHQHAPHRPRGEGEEVGAALPAHVGLVAEAQPRLVHERRGLEGVAVALAAQGALRVPAELRVHEPREPLARPRVARAPRAQQLGDCRARGGDRRGRRGDVGPGDGHGVVDGWVVENLGCDLDTRNP
jgi:hypothetical protein